MFPYGDPTGTGSLHSSGALATYQALLHGMFRHFGRVPRSGFTIPEAFAGLSGTSVNRAVVKWVAFPRAAEQPDDAIDANRFRLQDEYVEWRVEREAGGRLSRITFTTEFSTYYEALAAADPEALLAEVHAVTGTQEPTLGDLFGSNFDPTQATGEARAARLLQRAMRNKWNNGDRSILFLTHPSSTLGALLNLAAACGVPNAQVAPKDMCSAVSGACVPTRNSDPAVCAAVQRLSQNQNSFTFIDPVGIVIDRLEGIWKLDGQQVDINTSALWKVSRNRRRATLEIPEGLTLVDDSITSGARVASRLTVGSEVIFAPDNLLPEWSRMGQESSRMLVD